MSLVYIQINTILTAHTMVCSVVLACLLLLFTGGVISISDSVDYRSTKPFTFHIAKYKSTTTYL